MMPPVEHKPPTLAGDDDDCAAGAYPQPMHVNLVSTLLAGSLVVDFYCDMCTYIDERQLSTC
jgi:hypothetical protein